MSRRLRSRSVAGLLLGLAAVAAAVPVHAQSSAPVADAVAYSVVSDSSEMAIALVPLSGGASTELWSGPFAQGLSWSPDGSVVASTLLALGTDGPVMGEQLIGVDGSARPTDGEGTAALIWVGPDLLVIEPRETGSQLRLVDVTGHTVQLLDGAGARVAGPIRAHPDGTRIAVAWEATEAGAPGMLSLYAAPEWTRLDLPIPATRSAWSPDGASLAAIAGSTVFVVDGTTGATRTAATYAAPSSVLEDVRWPGDGSRLIVTTRAVVDGDPNVSLVSVPAVGPVVDLAAPGDGLIELATGIEDVVHAAVGPLDAPLAWWSYGSAVLDWEQSGTFRSGIVARDGRSSTDLADITGPAPLLTWDPSGTRLAISDAAGLSILDAATLTVSPLVAEPDHAIVEAAWHGPTD